MFFWIHSLICFYAICIHFFFYDRFGDERYEQSDMQKQVRKQFDKLQKVDEAEGRVPWHFVNAAQTVDEVQRDINKIVESTISSVQEKQKPVGKLWKAEK